MSIVENRTRRDKTSKNLLESRPVGRSEHEKEELDALGEIEKD
jgi:hypothetical protein